MDSKINIDNISEFDLIHNRSGYGFGVLKQSTGFLVTVLLENSYASSVLKIGDKVLTINNKDIKNMLQAEVLEILKFSNEEIKIKIERDNKEYVFKKENYFKKYIQ